MRLAHLRPRWGGSESTRWTPQTATTTHPLRVLMVVDTLRLGGAERVLVNLARAAPAAGFAFSVVALSPEGDGLSAMTPMLTAAGIHTSFLGISRLADPRAVPRIAQAIRQSNCDIVHAHLDQASTLVPPAAALARRPAVCTLHTVPRPLVGREAVKERLSISMASRAAAVLFVSQASLEGFATVTKRRPNWLVVPNGVDLTEFSPADAILPADIPVPVGAPVATFVGVLRDQKGQSTAVAAWPEVLSRFPQARLLLVGTGSHEAGLRAQAAASGVADHVILTGGRDDVPAIIRASTLVVLSSEGEALPTVLIEAAGCGRAVVATSVGGIPDVVVDGETGLLVPPGDVRALGDAIIRLFHDHALRHEMELRARELAVRRFALDLWARRLSQIYRAVLVGDRSSASAPVPPRAATSAP
jgi:glycosyltransferase involved in cell wall biosynthesis